MIVRIAREPATRVQGLPDIGAISDPLPVNAALESVSVQPVTARTPPLCRAGRASPAHIYFASLESSFTIGEILAVTGGRPVS